MMSLSLLCFLLFHFLFCFTFAEDGNPYDHLQCRDPSFGGGHHDIQRRKFLVISGVGGGIGNYLVFFPAAYYFAALTGRDILVLDNSLIGEMCNVIHCGFALYSQAAAVYPMILPPKAEGVRTVKAYDFMNHVWRGALIEDRVVIASGYQYKSGFYGDNEFARQCVHRLSGCTIGDGSCEDRYAIEKLVVGPFHSRFRDPSMQHFYHIAGIPHNLRDGILSLPHSLAPRIDAAVHLRCQFSHFEWVVGPEDNQWADYLKEVDGWLNSTDFNRGVQLFRLIEQKIIAEIPRLKSQRGARRRLLSEGAGSGEDVLSFEKGDFDAQVEKQQYHGDGKSDRVFVYLSSDNDRVKEAFAKYLEDHDKIAVMRVKNDYIVTHAKHYSHLSQNSSIGGFTLIMDWYALSLANTIFARRSNTGMLSTFAQSAASISGSSEEIEIQIMNGTTPVNRNTVYGKERFRGFQLVATRGVAWNPF